MDSWQWVHDSLTHNGWQFLKALGKLQLKLNYYFCSLHVGMVFFSCIRPWMRLWNNIKFSSSGKWKGMVSLEGLHGRGFFFLAQRKTSLIAKSGRNTTQGLDPRELKPRVEGICVVIWSIIECSFESWVLSFHGVYIRV